MKSGSARVPVGESTYPPVVHQAMIRALKDFRETHGRDPDWSEVDFRGGSTTSDVVFEIVER